MTRRASALAATGKLLAVLLILSVSCHFPAHASESFGNIDVSPLPSHDGATHHGYREFRVLLENRSATESHRVTLVLPDRRSYAWGNSIRSLSRTTVLGPRAQAVVSLWQPPLPIFSGGGMEVIVDDELLGSANVPNPQRHFTPGSMRGYSGLSPVTILAGRTFDQDELSRSFHGNGSAFSAAMATGEPDAGMAGGIHPTGWMPDPGLPGPHWIELDYATPFSGGVVVIHETAGVLGFSGATLLFRNHAGSNLHTAPVTHTAVPIGHTGFRPVGVPNTISISIPPSAEPIHSIRIEIPPGHSVCIDAVGVSSTPGARPADVSWATAARVSSEASVATVPFLSGHVQNQRQFLRSDLPIAEWSEQWLSYTPYDAVILGRADQSLMTGGVFAALRSYVAAGGCLVLLGDPDVLKRLDSSGAAVPLDDGHRLDFGFGSCFVFHAEKPAELSASSIKAMLDAAESSARFWQLLPADEAANSLFPVVENVAIPVRGIVLVMLGFVLLIGPANLIILARLKRRIWMLWTIPAISLATCALVFVYSFVREGFTPDCRLESLTYLDQPNRHAASVGAAAFYCPLTPNEGLQFSADTEATPLVQTADHRNGTPRELDWTQAQHLRRGWITARVPAHFYLRKSEPRRERLILSRAEGTLEVINGLGAPVISLLLSDPAGQLYEASRIAAGQKSTLLPADASLPSNERSRLRALFLQPGLGAQSAVLSTNAASYLLPGTYLAELDGNPFLETGFGEGATRTRARAFVYGVLDPPVTP